MANKPQAQEHEPQVASLSLDADELEQLDDIKDESSATTANEKPKNDAAREAMIEDATKYLKRGFDQKSIAERLVKHGISRPEALELVREVWKANLDERRYNANILFGTATICLVLGLGFFAWSVSITNSFPLVSPAYPLLAFAAWFYYKAWDAYSNLQ